MKAVFLRGLLLLVAVSVAGCASMRGGPEEEIEVTRVHLGQPLARGQIAVEAFEPADANMAEFRTYAASVERQLARLGWTVVNSVGQSEQVALVDVEQGSRAALLARGMRIGAAATPGESSSNAMATMLEVRIKRRSDGSLVWEGRALSDGGSDNRTAAVERLSEALFRDFPGESGRTIRTR